MEIVIRFQQIRTTIVLRRFPRIMLWNIILPLHQVLLSSVSTILSHMVLLDCLNLVCRFTRHQIRHRRRRHSVNWHIGFKKCHVERIVPSQVWRQFQSLGNFPYLASDFQEADPPS